MKENDNKNSFQTLEEDSIGEVQIANEVVATIAGISAMEVEGVNSMAGNITNELIGKLGVKNLAKGVKVEVNGESVIVDIAINMNYGYNIPNTSREVQEKVSQAVNNMTGLTVNEVNVRIAGVSIEKE